MREVDPNPKFGILNILHGLLLGKMPSSGMLHRVAPVKADKYFLHHQGDKKRRVRNNRSTLRRNTNVIPISPILVT
jgi:hypothetical protein